MYKHNVHVKGYIHVWPSMPSSHACMPLFTTWYALIPGIILFLTGGIRPYAPRQLTPAVLASALRPLSLPEDGTAAAILALEFGGLRCAAAAFYPHLINCSPPSEGISLRKRVARLDLSSCTCTVSTLVGDEAPNDAPHGGAATPLPPVLATPPLAYG